MVLAAVAVALVTGGVVIAISGDEDPVGPSSRPVAVSDPTESGPTSKHDEGEIPFRRFPLDRGWPEVYGSTAVNGPDEGSGGISMPEGHCEEGVLFESGYDDKLSTYVSEGESSLTRQLLGYPSPREALSAFRAVRDAVGSCPGFDDAYTERVAYAVTVRDDIDETNARDGRTTFTFAYTTAPDSAPFGILYQFAVVDDVLYGSSEYGEWAPAAARQALPGIDETNRSLVGLLDRVERPRGR